MHQLILNDVKANGVVACTWRTVLNRWKEFIAEAPFEDVEFGCIRAILQNARLTSIAQPTSYETLRKLGGDMLHTDVENEDERQNLLRRLLTPGQGDTEWYAQYFGSPDKWFDDSRSLANHLDKLHAMNGTSLSQELKKEKLLGFMVPHIRSNRYHPVELGAIILHLVRDIDPEATQHWVALAKRLQTDVQPLSEHSSEAQAFILRCFENIYRSRQSLEGAEKRNGAVGVVLFGDISADAEHGEIQSSILDEWFDQEMASANSMDRSAPMPLERCTLKQIRQLIQSEEDLWKEWEPKLRKRKGKEFKVAKQPLFDQLRASKLSYSSLLSHVMNAIKAYCEKKKNLLDLALKSSRKHCVLAAIEDSGSDSQQAAMTAPKGGRRIAVFGYTLNTDLKGVPEVAEQSVIVRSVPLKRMHAAEELGSSDELDTRVFEIGVSLAGSYLAFCPGDSDELHDMLKTSGLGLGKDDRMHFFMYVPQGQHAPRSKPIDDLLCRREAGDEFTHALLTIPDAPGRLSYSEIADAGGRFLIDLWRVGSVKTEGMRYQPLAVEPAASVSVAEDGKAYAFRRLAVLLPPSLHNEMPPGYRLGRLGMEADAGPSAGFKESAEIIAEVLSLVAIDKSKMEDSSDSACYRAFIREHLEGNPLILYYTSLELLNTVDPVFARILAEYWEEKLGLGANSFAAKLGREELECRRLVFSLITSGIPHSRGAGLAELPARRQIRSPAAGGGAVPTPGRTPRSDVAGQGCAVAGSVATGKKIALASEGHLRLLPSIIQRETHFAQEEIYVEESNFESVLLRLKRATPTSLTFVFVYITGRISADQINQFVSVPASNIRLIFRYSQSLLSLLDLTPSIRDIIHRPASISEALMGRLQVVAYSTQSAVGAMVTYNTNYIAKDPTAIRSKGLFWDDDYPEKLAKQGAVWKDDIERWVCTPVDSNAGPAEFLRIIVTPDHAITAKQLESCFFQSQESQFNVQTIDAGDRSDFDELKSFVDNQNAPSFSYSKVKNRMHLPAHEDVADMELHFTSEILILCRATFLPHARLEILVSRCCSRRIKLILLATEAISSISRFRVFKDASSPPIWIRVPILKQRLAREIVSLRLRLAFTGLQMLFSQEAVVTDDHYSSLDSFIKGSLSDYSALGFLDHIEGIPSDGSVRTAFIMALSCTEESTMVSSDSLIQKATLAQIMCMHINRYLRYPESGEDDLISLSFQEFCQQPRSRFLCQIHRIEAYIYYIYSKTKKPHRLPSKASPESPLGCPLTACFPEIDKNIHSSPSPGSLLGAIFNRDHESVLDVKVPVPQYVDPGRGDAVLHMQEIAEFHAIKDAELNWEEMFLKWESGPDIADEILDHIFIHSHSRISILLCMTAPQIVNLGLSAQALRAVSHDFENCQRSLRQLDARDFRTLRTRAAAIWWLLLTKGENLMRQSEETFAEDQSLLLDSGIYIEPKQSTSDSAPDEMNTQLLIQVATAMLPLDRPDTFTSQHAVRDFLLSNSNETVVARILDDQSCKIGQAFINACVARETLNKIMLKTLGSAVFDRMKHIFRWIKDSQEVDVEEMKREMQSWALRLTPLAVSCLLLSANPPVNLCKARYGILEPCLSIIERVKGAEEAKRTLDEILKVFCNDSNRGFTIELFHILAQLPETETGADYVFPVPDLIDVPDTWNAIYKTMRDSSHAASMLLTAKENNFALPFEASDKLCSIYIDYFCADGRDPTRDIDEHIVFLRTDLAKDAIYKYVSNLKFETKPLNLQILGLLWFTWWSIPWTAFALRFLPSPETWHLFQIISTKALSSSCQEKIQQGLSTVARFAVAPHTLPASMLNTLKCVMVDRKELIFSKNYVLAQLGHPSYPVYGFRCHGRPLPRACVDSLRKDIGKCILKGFSGRDENEKMKALFPITDSGVSADTVRHNLNILVHIHETPQSLERHKTPELRAQIFLPAFAWFLSAGIQLSDMKSMCSEDHKKKLADNYATMLSVWRTTDFPKSLVYCPLPVYCDVRFVCGKATALFQGKPESANNTIHWLGMLGLQYNLQNYNAAEHFQSFVSDRNAGKIVDPDQPKVILRTLMAEIGKEISRRYTNVSTRGNMEENYHLVLVLEESEFMSGEQWLNLMAAVNDFFQIRVRAGAKDLVSLVLYDGSAVRQVCQMENILACSDRCSNIVKMAGGNKLETFAPALSKARELLVMGQTEHPGHAPFLLFLSVGGADDGQSEMQARFTPHDIKRSRAAFTNVEANFKPMCGCGCECC